MNRLKPHITYANVVASLALVLALTGGTAFAASQLAKNSVGSPQLKKNAVTTAKIKKEAVATAKIKQEAINGSLVKDGSLTGSDINLGSLGTVPNAATANTANTTNQITGFTYKGKNGDSDVTVLSDFNGLSLFASCTSGANNGLTTKASSSAAGGASLSWTSSWQGTESSNNAYTQMNAGTKLTMTDPAGTTKTTNGAGNIGWSSGQIVYAQNGTGKRVTVTWSYLNNIAGSDCYWVGNVVASG